MCARAVGIGEEQGRVPLERSQRQHPPSSVGGIALGCHAGMLRPLTDQLAIADRTPPL